MKFFSVQCVLCLFAVALGVGCETSPATKVRTVERIMRPTRLVGETDANGLLVRQPQTGVGRGQIEVMVLYGGVASSLQHVPGQERRVGWSELIDFDPYDVRVSAEALKANAGRDGYQPDKFQPISFLIDPATSKLTETAPSSWINTPTKTSMGEIVPPLTFDQYQWRLAFRLWPGNVPFVPQRDDMAAVDRSQRFLAKLAVGSSLADVRAPTKGFRSRPWGLWVLFYDRITGNEAALPVELGRDTGGRPWMGMAFTPDSQWLVLVPDTPARAMWVIPTGLPRPEEPWTPR